MHIYNASIFFVGENKKNNILEPYHTPNLRVNKRFPSIWIRKNSLPLEPPVFASAASTGTVELPAAFGAAGAATPVLAFAAGFTALAAEEAGASQDEP